MNTGALVLGIIGGVLGTLIGLFGFTLGQAFSGIAEDARVFQLISLAIPLVGLIGGGIVKAQPVGGGVMMLGSSITMCAFFGIHFLSLLPGIFLFLGGILALVGSMQENTSERHVEC